MSTIWQFCTNYTFKMNSANSTSWEKELRKNICTNFGRGIRVNGENSGRTKLLNGIITPLVKISYHQKKKIYVASKF